MKRTTIFLFTFLLVLTLVNGQPFLDQEFTGDLGLQVEFPAFPSGKSSTAFEFPFHVYNLSNGRVLNTSVECVFHVYNSTGNHLFEATDTTVSHGFDYEFAINNTLFSQSGLYRFVTTCVHDNGVGGFVAHGFEITDTGLETLRDGTLLIIMLAIAIFIWTILKISSTLSEEHFLLKFFLSIIAFITAFSSIALSVTIIGYSNLSSSIINNTSTIWKIVSFSFYMFMAYIVLYYMYKALIFLNAQIKK